MKKKWLLPVIFTMSAAMLFSACNSGDTSGSGSDTAGGSKDDVYQDYDPNKQPGGNQSRTAKQTIPKLSTATALRFISIRLPMVEIIRRVTTTRLTSASMVKRVFCRAPAAAGAIGTGLLTTKSI